MKITFVFVLLAVVLFCRAQFPVDTNYFRINTGDVPALPEVNGYVIDSSVPSPVKITRITDYNADWDWYPVYEYAKIQPWNCDTTMYKFYTVAVFDAQTNQIIRELPGDLYPSYWSNVNPDLIYGFRENGDIKAYMVSPDSSQILFHIDGYDVIKLGPGEGNVDKNDKYVALVGKKGIDMDVLIFDLQEKNLVAIKTFPGAWGDNESQPYYVDWVSVSQSGKFTGIMWDHNTTSEEEPFDGHYGIEIYNTTDLNFVRRLARYGNHGDFGFTPDSQEVFVQFWGETGTVNAYYLSKDGGFVVCSNADFGGEGHISCRNLKRPGWAYVSIDEPDYGVMVAMKLDTSGSVEYFGHHYSSADNYVKSPMPVPNPFGNKIMFKSDFGNYQNPDEVYCFTAEAYNIPPAQEKSRGQKISLYPNPVREYLYIQAFDKMKRVSIYNTTGKKIRDLQPQSSFAAVNFNGVPDGIYILRILFENTESFFKVVKTKSF